MSNKKYAVSICNLSDVELFLKITEGRNWREALRNTFPEYEEKVKEYATKKLKKKFQKLHEEENVVSGNLEDAQEKAYEQDWLLSIEEIQF